MKRTRNSQAGFTLNELLISVAVIGGLGAIAVPVFAKDTRNAKGDAEVNAFFAELRVREEQFHFENGVYLSTGLSESDSFPASPSKDAKPLGATPATWTALKISPPESNARCAYVVVTGTATGGIVGPIAQSMGFVPPARNWFYVLAHCDLDGSSAKDSYYLISSDDPKVRKLNPGS